MWLCSYVAIWLCGHMATWLCGYVAMGLDGYVAMWLCGYVAMWLSSKIPKFQTGLRYSQTIISCFQVDIGPISKISRHSWTDLHHFSVPVFSKFYILSRSIYAKIIFLRMFPHTFSYLSKHFWYNKSHKYGLHGLGNPEITKMSSFMFKIMKSGL